MIFYGHPEFDAEITAVIREHNELTRIAAQRICDYADAGKSTADPETLVWARQFVERVKPLGRAL